MPGQGTQGERSDAGAMKEDRYSAGEAVVARVETMPQPEKSGVSSYIFREQWKNT